MKQNEEPTFMNTSTEGTYTNDYQSDKGKGKTKCMFKPMLLITKQCPKHHTNTKILNHKDPSNPQSYAHDRHVITITSNQSL